MSQVYVQVMSKELFQTATLFADLSEVAASSLGCGQGVFSGDTRHVQGHPATDIRDCISVRLASRHHDGMRADPLPGRSTSTPTCTTMVIRQDQLSCVSPLVIGRVALHTA